MLFASLPLEPVIDCAGRNRRGQRSKVAWRRAGDRRELAEAPVGQAGGSTRRLANDELVGVVRLGPERAGFDAAFFDPLAPCASGLVERVNAGEPFIRWARRPFPVRGVRRDSGHTNPGHMVLLAACPEGDEVETAPTSGDVEGWPGRPQRRYLQNKLADSHCQEQQMLSQVEYAIERSAPRRPSRVNRAEG